MFDLPITIIIDNQEFPIRERGDFRMILDCFKVLEDTELSKQERMIACLIIFYEDINSIGELNKLSNLEEAVKKMYWFFNCGGDKSPGVHSNYKLVDWKHDEQLIASAINNVAKKEIRNEDYIHFWTFMGYYTAIGESPLSNIVSIRNKIVKGKKLEKYEREFRAENPHYFKWNRTTIEQQEAEDWVQQMWNAETG